MVSTGCLLWTEIAKVPWDPRDRGNSGRRSVVRLDPRSPRYPDTLAMRSCRQVGCEADKRQDLHGTLARGGVNRGMDFDCSRHY